MTTKELTQLRQLVFETLTSFVYHQKNPIEIDCAVWTGYEASGKFWVWSFTDWIESNSCRTRWGSTKVKKGTHTVNHEGKYPSRPSPPQAWGWIEWQGKCPVSYSVATPPMHAVWESLKILSIRLRELWDLRTYFLKGRNQRSSTLDRGNEVK